MIDAVGRRRIPGFAHERMRTARLAKGWTQGRLAAEADVSVVSITAWERGLRAPEPPAFRALAAGLALEPSELLSLAADEWTLVELRIVSGLYQQVAAKTAAIAPDRLSHLESGYERLDDRTRQALASVYNTTEATIEDCWKRGRDRLRAND